MAAGGAPTVQVVLDDATGTFPYDVTQYLRRGEALTATRGRQDEQSTVEAGGLGAVFKNNDGRFSPGSTLIGSPSPVVTDQRIRTKFTPGGNLLTADQSSFETGTGGLAFNALLGARDLGTSIGQSALHPTDGTNCLLLTWSTTIKGNTALISVPTVIGQVYTFSFDLWVPAGSPDVRATASFIGSGPTISTKNTTVRTSVTFTATGTSSSIGVECLSATAGQQCFIDSLALNLGPTALPFVIGGLTRNRCTGYLAADTVTWPGGKSLSLVPITAVDAQARAQRQTLRSVVEEEIFVDSPTAYYEFSEPAGATTAADSSGNQRPALKMAGSGADVVFGTAIGPTTDGLTAATFAGGKYLTAATGGGLWSGYVIAFSTSSVAAATLMAIDTGSFIGMSCTIDATGRIFDGVSWTSPSPVTDGALHVIELVATGGNMVTFFDGVQVASVAGGGGTGGTLSIGSGFVGTMAHVAGWPTGGVPVVARPPQHAQAMLTGFAGESGTARLTRLAGYANLPIGTLDTSLTNVPFVDFTGASVWDAIQQVADAEFGLVFFDGSGNLTFHNRNRAIAKLAPDITITADALDEGTVFTTDMQGVLNYYEVTSSATGITQLVRNTVSEKGDGTAAHPGHGRYPGSADYLVQTDAEALDRGNWVVSTHAEPQPRVGTLNIDLFTQTAAIQDALLAAEPDTWIRVTGLPSQTPGGTTADFIVEGFADSLNTDAWPLTLNVANKAVAAPTPWILGDATYSVLGSTTRLYV